MSWSFNFCICQVDKILGASTFAVSGQHFMSIKSGIQTSTLWEPPIFREESPAPLIRYLAGAGRMDSGSLISLSLCDDEVVSNGSYNGNSSVEIPVSHLN